MYYHPLLAFHNSDKFRTAQDLVLEAYVYYPGPYSLLLPLKIKMINNSIREGVHVLPPICHNRQEEGRIILEI